LNPFGLTNLVSGTPWDPSQTTVLEGQVQIGPTSLKTLINGQPARGGERVVPGAEAAWTVQHGTQRIDGAFAKALSPVDRDIDALLEMRGDYERVRKAGSSWKEWVSLSPLAPQADESVRMQPLDLAVQNRLRFLEAVARNPRSHLRVDDALVAVSRVRRVAPKAVQRFVSHKEDWDRPTVLAVRPRSVLSVSYEEEIDIYENRLAARLIDRLDVYLRRRLETVTAVQTMLAESGHSGASADSGQYRRRDRLYHLWGEAFTNSDTEETAAGTASLLESLHVRIRTLKDSNLYRGVARRAEASGLRYTNIFRNDPDYREVARLWSDWSSSATRFPSEKDLYIRRQALCQGATWFGWLLVVRAMVTLGAQLHGAPQPVQNQDAGTVIDTPVGPVEIVPPASGACLLRLNGASLRVVCLPARVDALDAATASAQLNQLKSAARESQRITGSAVLVLLVSPRAAHAAGSAGTADCDICRAGRWEAAARHEPDRDADLGVVAVSPWDISSVERVARCLRWHLWSGTLRGYPPKVSLGSDWPVKTPPWLVQVDARGTAKIQRSVRSNEQSCEQLLLDVERSQRSGIANPKTQKRDAESAKQKIDGLRQELESGLARVKQVERCPICSEESARLTPGTHDCFEALCGSCEATWGVYRCACGERFPFIKLAQLKTVLASSGDRELGWLDRLLGADVLSCVCPEAPAAKPTFVCPKCGKCGCGPNDHASATDTTRTPPLS
jgi:hypothetical protein